MNMELNRIVSSQSLHRFAYRYLTEIGVNKEIALYINQLVLVIAVLLISWIFFYITRRFLLGILNSVALKTSTAFDDFLVKNKVMMHVSRLVPYIIIKNSLPYLFQDFKSIIPFLTAVLDFVLIMFVVGIFRAFFKSCRDYLKTKELFKDKPVDSYLQVVSLFMYAIAGIMIFSLVTGMSAKAFVAGLGAASAVLMLIFKDTILGFVASVQVSTNDMVRIGDWIEMPKFGADGDVIEINLNTVKIQNWDKTITNIPTYYLISDSFKNWRGMHSFGGRRIKRAIHIKISSIHFVTEEEIDKLKSIQLLKPYIESRQLEIVDFNAENQVDTENPINGRHLTNVGLFRKYVEEYAKQKKGINTQMTLMVRHLAPGEKGLPIELYMFTDKTVWAYYENVMADIFDHILATVPYFNLEVFELPASDDLRNVKLSVGNFEK